MRRHALSLIGLVLTLGAWSCTKSSIPQEAAVPVSAASPVPGPPEDVEATIIKLEREWVSGILKKDIATLDRLLASDFVGTSATAHTFSKTDAIEEIRNSTYVVDKMDMDEVSVNSYGTTAVSFTSQKEKSRYDGKDTSGHYHFTDTWVKRDGLWRVVASHGSRFDKPAVTEKTKGK